MFDDTEEPQGPESVQEGPASRQHAHEKIRSLNSLEILVLKKDPLINSAILHNTWKGEVSSNCTIHNSWKLNRICHRISSK